MDLSDLIEVSAIMPSLKANSKKQLLQLLSERAASLIGIPERDRDGALIEDLVYDAVEEAFETMPRKRRSDPDAVAEAVRRAVRSTVAQRWGKKPMCHVHVLAV